MELFKAKNGRGWEHASDILLAVAQNLIQKGQPLWAENQVSEEGLKQSYQLDELHFLVQEDIIGVAFLQKTDEFFWPEIKSTDTLYLHKFAIHPTYSGQQFGQQGIRLIKNDAANRGCAWLRLDCDDRPQLHAFYQRCGFQFVDLRQIATFRVARYEMQIAKSRKYNEGLK